MSDGDRSLNKLHKWIEDNLRYPEKAKKEGMQGRVTIGFTITKEGRLTNVKVLRGCHPLLDAEAVRVIETTAKKWSDFSYVYPVIFRL